MVNSIFGQKPGNAITRQYRNAKKLRNIAAINSIGALALGYSHAKNGSKFVFMDIVTFFLSGKFAEKSQFIINVLKPEYNKIVARAKSIKGRN